MTPSQVGQQGRRKAYPPTTSPPRWASRWSSSPHWASRLSNSPHWASGWSTLSSWVVKDINIKIHTPNTHWTWACYAEHDLHCHWTSKSPNTLSGISRQWRWYHTWQESHSAISSPSCSGILHVQWRFIAKNDFIGSHLQTSIIGKNSHFSKHMTKCCLILLWSNIYNCARVKTSANVKSILCYS